jgi:hypothetical protein
MPWTGRDHKAELVRRGIRLKDAAQAIGYSAGYLSAELGQDRPISPRLAKCLQLLLANLDAGSPRRGFCGSDAGPVPSA